MLKKFLFALTIAGLISCSDDEPQNAHIQISLVDAPAAYEAVNVDVQEVHVRFGAADSDESENGWEDISDFDPEVINLLDLVNGKEEVLVDREIPTGTLGEVRLVLGENNSLTMDGQTTALKVPSGSSSGLKIKLNEDLLAGVTYKLVLDFDAAKSIVQAGNSGKFNLNPVIHASMEAQTGAIAGSVDPATEGIVVYAIVGEDSVSTYTDATGDFLIRALEANTYQVAAVSETDTSRVEGIEVVIGEVAEAGTLEFDN